MKRLNKKYIGTVISEEIDAEPFFQFLHAIRQECGIFNKVKKYKDDAMELYAILRDIAPKDSVFGWSDGVYKFYIPVAQAEDLETAKKWFNEAKQCTFRTLPSFLNKMVFETDHQDPGSGAHALTAVGIAAMAAASNKITLDEYSSSIAAMNLVRQWNGFSDDEPIYLMRYKDLLFPVMEPYFTEIHPKTWEYIQKEAADLLDKYWCGGDHWSAEWKDGNVEFEAGPHPKVLTHLRSIAVDKKIPFGFKLRKVDDDDTENSGS